MLNKINKASIRKIAIHRLIKLYKHIKAKRRMREYLASDLSSGTSTGADAVELGCEEGDSAEFVIEFPKPCDSGASVTIPHNKHN
jgi:hypothetical protein